MEKRITQQSHPPLLISRTLIKRLNTCGLSSHEEIHGRLRELKSMVEREEGLCASLLKTGFTIGCMILKGILRGLEVTLICLTEIDLPAICVKKSCL